MNIQSFLVQHATRRPDHLAVVFNEHRLTYRTFNNQVNQLANALLNNGIKKGDKVATLLPNSLELLHLYGAATKIGIVVVPLSPMLRGEGLSNQLNNAHAVLLLTNKNLSIHIDKIKGDLLFLKDIWVTDSDATLHNNYYKKTALATQTEPPYVEIKGDDPYNIFYSSGTTGAPKGIVHSHKVRAMYATLFANYWRMTPESVVLHSGSIVFNGSFLTLMPWLFLGTTYILCESFKPEKVLDLIQQEKVSHMGMVPSQIIGLLQLPTFTRKNTPSIEMIMSVGAPLAVEFKNDLTTRINGGFYELYGLTEGFVTILDKTHFESKKASVGAPPPFSKIKIVDNEGYEVPVGTIGEIIGKSPFLMSEYYNNPALTTKTVIDGWLYSGDLGYVDEDGFLFLTGRKKDLIISGGVNVYPADLEATILKNEAVLDVAVFGVPHDAWGESPVAAVRLKTSKQINPSTLKKWINKKIEARYQKINDVIIVDSFPQNVAGKTLKRVLKVNYLKLNQMPLGESKYITTNNIDIHYLHHKGDGPIMILMHGLSSNARAFDGLVEAGLCSNFDLFAIDLRGRGLSDKPSTGYSMQEHAQDIIGIIKQISPDQPVILGGHSFGGLVSMYLTAKYPEYVSKVIIIDSGARFHPDTMTMLQPIRERLDRVFPSFEAYVDYFNMHNILDGTWNDLVKIYLEADAETREDGSILARPKLDHIVEAAQKLALEDWDTITKAIAQPTLLINGPEGFGPKGAAPLISEKGAKETVAMLQNGTYLKVKGSHLNMMWESAEQMVEAIKKI